MMEKIGSTKLLRTYRSTDISGSDATNLEAILRWYGDHDALVSCW